jgi:hypothetical protein
MNVRTISLRFLGIILSRAVDWIHWIRIRIHHFKWIWIQRRVRRQIRRRIQSGSRVWWPKTEEKKHNRKLQFTYSMSKLQEKPSALKREHPSLQTWNVLAFFSVCGSFSPSWIRIRIQGPHWIRIQALILRVARLEDSVHKCLPRVP